MTAPVKIYQKEMHANLGFFATWLPGDRIELGDIGVLNGGCFRKLSSLAELGISCQLSSEGSPVTLQYTSTKGTKMNLKGSASASAVKAKAEIIIEFSKAGSFLFHASNVRHIRINDLSSITARVMQLLETGRWEKGWHLIDSQHIAETATIIISQDETANISLFANAHVPLGAIPLADPNVKLTVASTSGKMVQVIGGQNLRPLYSCLRIQDYWFNPPALVPVRGRIVNTKQSKEIWLKPSIEELLKS